MEAQKAKRFYPKVLKPIEASQLLISKDIEQEVVSKDIYFDLSQEDFVEYGKEAAEEARKLGDAEREFDDVKEHWKSKIRGLQGGINSALRTIRNARHEKNVKVIKQKDFKNKTLSYIFEGIVIEELPLNETDRQVHMFPKGTKLREATDPDAAIAQMKDAISPEEAAKMGAGANGQKPAKKEQGVFDDLHDVRRDETTVGKHSRHL